MVNNKNNTIRDMAIISLFILWLVSFCGFGYNMFINDAQIQDLETNLTYVIMLNDGYHQYMIDNITQLNRDIYHQNLTIERIKFNLTTYILENNKLLSETQILRLKLNDEINLHTRPTYAEVVAFLKEDKTDRLEWTKDFDCTQFTTTVLRNARAKGLIGCMVEINFNDGYGHAIVAFNTLDMGIQYFEPQSDENIYMYLNMDYGSYLGYENKLYVTLYDSCYELVQLED